MGKKNKGATNVQSEDTLPLRGKAPPDGGYDDEKYETFENGSYLKSRVALAIFAILTLVIGVVFFIFGIVVLVAHHITLRDLEFLIDFTYFRICVIIILVLGIIFIVVSIVGLVGTIKFGKFLLNAYAVGLGFVSVILIVGGALLIVFRGQFASDSLRFDYLRNAIVTQYRVDVEIDKNNRFVTNTIDYIQENYECCGAYGNVTSEYSWAIYKTKSLWYTSKNDKFPMVPESCCVRGGSLARLPRQTRIRRTAFLWARQKLHGTIPICQRRPS